MYALYKGKNPCPGCGRTGEEHPRFSKDGLCMECAEALKIGKALIEERNLERGSYCLEELTKAFLTWYTIRTDKIERALRNLLSKFSKFDSKYAAGCTHRAIIGEISATCGRDVFVLPTETYEAAKELCEAVRDASYEIEQKRDNYKKELDKELANEKNRIYNEGVAYGRNLLMQLNNNEITPDEFTKPVKRY